MKNIAVISVDKRQEYLLKYLNSHNYNACLKTNLDFTGQDIIICGTPLSKDIEYLNCDFYSRFPLYTFIDLLKPGQIMFAGNISEEVANICKHNHITTVDVLKNRSFAMENAYYTAEGLMGILIRNTNFTIRKSNVLVLGLGKCGNAICNLLSKLDAKVYFYDNKDDVILYGKDSGYKFLDILSNMKELSGINIIVNTVPETVVPKKAYNYIAKDCEIYDIASAPGGFIKDDMERQHLTLHTCPGIPGRFSPKNAGELIAKNIISFLEGTD